MNYTFLKIFGCEAYAHIDKETRKKLDPKSLKCYFIGYGVDGLGYKLWDNVGQKVIRSRDVVFNENRLYKDRHMQNDVEEPEFIDLEDVPSNGIKVQQDAQVEEHVKEEEPHTPPPPPLPEVRRSTRVRNAPDHYSPTLHYILYTDAGEPKCLHEAL